MGKFDFSDEVWTNISDSAKDLISHMIVVDVDQRYSIEQVLQHPWLSPPSSRSFFKHARRMSHKTSSSSSSPKRKPMVKTQASSIDAPAQHLLEDLPMLSLDVTVEATSQHVRKNQPITPSINVNLERFANRKKTRTLTMG